MILHVMHKGDNHIANTDNLNLSEGVEFLAR